MPDIDIECIADVRCQLGEGPVWDPREQAIYWIDIAKARIYRLEYPDGPLGHWDLPGKTIGSLALREGGGAVLSMDRGFYTFDFDTAGTEMVAEPLRSDERSRFNDGKTDRQGRFFAGSMDIEAEAPIGVLYRLDPDLSCTQIEQDSDVSTGRVSAPMHEPSTARVEHLRQWKHTTTIHPPANALTDVRFTLRESHAMVLPSIPKAVYGAPSCRVKCGASSPMAPSIAA